MPAIGLPTLIFGGLLGIGVAAVCTLVQRCIVRWRRTRRVAWVSLGAALGLAIGVTAVLPLFMYTALVDHEVISHDRRIRGADHAAVFKACVDMMGRRKEFQRGPGIDVREKQVVLWRERGAEHSLPPELRALRPRDVWVGDTTVSMTMTAGHVRRHLECCRHPKECDRGEVLYPGLTFH